VRKDEGFGSIVTLPPHHGTAAPPSQESRFRTRHIPSFPLLGGEPVLGGLVTGTGEALWKRHPDRRRSSPGLSLWTAAAPAADGFVALLMRNKEYSILPRWLEETPFRAGTSLSGSPALALGVAAPSSPPYPWTGAQDWPLLFIGATQPQQAMLSDADAVVLKPRASPPHGQRAMPFPFPPSRIHARPLPFLQRESSPLSESLRVNFSLTKKMR